MSNLIREEPKQKKTKWTGAQTRRNVVSAVLVQHGAVLLAIDAICIHFISVRCAAQENTYNEIQKMRHTDVEDHFHKMKIEFELQLIFLFN